MMSFRTIITGPIRLILQTNFCLHPLPIHCRSWLFKKKSASIFVCKWIMFWKVWQMSVDKPTDITSLTIRINILFIFWLFSIFCMQMNHGYFNFVSELCFETGLIQQQEKKGYYKLVHVLLYDIFVILGWYHDNLGWKYCLLF